MSKTIPLRIRPTTNKVMYGLVNCFLGSLQDELCTRQKVNHLKISTTNDTSSDINTRCPLQHCNDKLTAYNTASLLKQGFKFSWNLRSMSTNSLEIT